MKRSSGFLVAGAALLMGAGPCRLPSGLPTGVVDAQDVASVATTGVKAGLSAAEGKRECDKLRLLAVDVTEETGLGGAVAVKRVNDLGGLVITPGTLDQKALAAPTVKLPDSTDNSLTRYVNRVGKTLAFQSKRPEIAWTFGVLKTDAVSAFSAPGGYVFVSRGLLKKMRSEDQLAGVLAHEIGHVVHKDALHLYQDVKANQCTTLVASDAAGEVGGAALRKLYPGAAAAMGTVLTAGRGAVQFSGANVDLVALLTDRTVEQLTSAGFSSEHEFQADEMAVELLTAAGYQPSEFTALVGGLTSDATFSSNHPTGAERLKRMTAYLTSRKEDPFAGPVVQRKPLEPGPEWRAALPR